MRKRLVVLLATSVIAVTACQAATSPSPSTATSPSASPSPIAASPSPSPALTQADVEAIVFGSEYEPFPGMPGGSVTIADWQSPDQLNPAYSYSFSNTQVLAATMRTLWLVTSDGHWKPDLAAKMPRFSDGSVREDADGTGFEVDIELRPGLRWSDGTPATVADLRFTWEWVNDPGQDDLAVVGWDRIDRVDVKGDLAATVHFKEAFPGYLVTIGGLFLPKHYVSTIPVAEAAAKSYPLTSDIAKAVTIGPFKYVTASADVIELTRDENWAGPAQACGGKSCLDRVTFKSFPDDREGMIAAFLAGEVDVAVDLIQSDYDAIKVVDRAVGKAILEPAWLYQHFDLNQQGLGQGKGHPALRDVRVRRAIAQAIDKDAMWQAVNPGQPLPDATPCAPATPTNYWQLPDAQCPAFDVAAANKALDDAGYKDSNGDGVREDPAGNELVLEHCTYVAGFHKAGGEFLAGQLKQIGIVLELNFVDAVAVLFAGWQDVAADTKCNLAHGNYDTAEFGYVLSFDLFGNYYYSYHSEQVPAAANQGNGYNYIRFTNPEMDAALDTLRSAIRPEEQLEAVHTVQRVYIDQVPEIVLYHRAEARGVAARLNNFFKNPSSSSDMWNIEDWWIAP